MRKTGAQYWAKFKWSSREERNTYSRERSRRFRNAILALLGNECVQCGFDDPRALQVDHVNGGGSKERKEDGSNPSTLLKKIQENPERYQLLCANCNWIKRFEMNEHKPITKNGTDV